MRHAMHMATISTKEKSSRTRDRMDLTLQLVSAGVNVMEAIADPRIGVSYSAYRQWRSRDPKWAAAVDVGRATSERNVPISELSSAQFAFRYFGRIRAPFQQQAITARETMRPGNILLMLWPPEHGKTTTFEDYATEKLCRVPEWRSTVASESEGISKKILGRVRKRLEPDGPYPSLVKDWGPFRPDAGRGQASNIYQPWNDEYFNVQRKQKSDERDFNMLALGWNSTTVSIRTDQLHIDDIQSTKTLNKTSAQLDWFRQDGLSRPGERGITTIAMTRVGDGDFPSALEDDEELDGILTVIKFRAIVKNPLTGEDEPLWPERFTLDGLDRIRRKVKDQAFDRNYMQQPGLSQMERTFSEEGRLMALDTSKRLNNLEPWEGEDLYVVLALDPGLDPGICVLQGWALFADTMELVYEREEPKLLRNEQIIDMVDGACEFLNNNGARVIHLTVEAMNFQRGLARDERLTNVKRYWGFTMTEHLTNNNKYDANIGVASMAGDWEEGNLRLPYSGLDAHTRPEVDELCRQLKNWKPLARGSKLRQDRVMTMWFAWIYWQQKRRRFRQEPSVWQRAGIPLATLGTKPSLIIPIGAKV